MASEVEFWRQDPTTKAENIAREVERLSHRARSASLGDRIQCDRPREPSSLSGHGERFGLEFYTDTRPNGYFARRAVRPPAHDSIFIPAVQMRRNSSSAALLNQSIQGNRSSACLKPQPLSSPP
jgi:hypothetical protein